MSIFNLIKKQLATVIEWKPQQPDVLLWKYPALTDEIKNASKLIVTPGQGCIIVYEGKVTDMLDQAGTYEIRTDNIPFITTLLKVMQFFESEHKTELYFYRKAEVLNQGWGTSAPVKYLDSVYKVPVKLSAFGNFSYKLSDPTRVFSELTGSVDQWTTAQFREIVQSRIPQLLITYFANRQLAFSEIDMYVNEIAGEITQQMILEFEKLGLQIIDFRIEGNQFDAGTEERIGRIADVTADAMAAAEAGLNYEQLERLRALRDAAKNEGGVAGIGAGLGAGLSMAQMLNQSDDQMTEPRENTDPVQWLQKLKLLLDENIITREEFDEKKKKFLNNL